VREIAQRGAHGLHSSTNIIPVTTSRWMRWAGQVARIGERRGAYRVSVERPERKKPHGISMRRRKDNIWNGCQIGGEGGERNYLARNTDKLQALVSTVMKIQIPQNSGNLLTRSLILEDWNDRLSRNVGNYQCTPCKSLIYMAAEATTVIFF